MYITFKDSASDTIHTMQLEDILYREKEQCLALSGNNASGKVYYESDNSIKREIYIKIKKALKKNRYCDLSKYSTFSLLYIEKLDVVTM